MGAYSKLHDHTYEELRRNFPHFTIRENIRPDWLMSSNLTKLELDIYIEEIETAIEIQGKQHYTFTPYFHKTYDHFRDQVRRDKEKRNLCYGKGVRLIEVAEDLDVTLFIDELKETEKQKEESKPKYFYSNPTTPTDKKNHRPKIDKEAKALKVKKTKYSIAHKKVLNRIRREQRKKKLAWMLRQGIVTSKEVIILPGTHRQRHHAREIHCSQITKNLWFVWGGERGIHKVSMHDKYECDCYYNDKINILCSHIIRVQMYLREFPSVNGTDISFFHRV